MHTRCAVSTDGLHGSSIYLLGRITIPINFLPNAVQCAKALHQGRMAVMEQRKERVDVLRAAILLVEAQQRTPEVLRPPQFRSKPAHNAGLGYQAARAFSFNVVRTSRRLRIPAQAAVLQLAHSVRRHADSIDHDSHTLKKGAHTTL